MRGAVHSVTALVLRRSAWPARRTLDVRIDQRKDLAGFRTWNFPVSHSGNVRAPEGDRGARRDLAASRRALA